MLYYSDLKNNAWVKIDFAFKGEQKSLKTIIKKL